MIAGPNGVGKSNALGALHDFQGLRSNSLGNRPCSQLTFKLAGNDSGGHLWAVQKEPSSYNAFADDDEVPENDTLNGFVLLRPRTENLSPSYTEQIPPVLGPSGSELASVVANMMTSAPEAFQQLLATFKRVIPQVRGLRAAKEKLTKVRKRKIVVDEREIVFDEADEVTGDALRFDMLSKDDLPASQISDGTLIVLTILTAIFQSKRPSLLLIDDLESGLHPEAQEKLVGQIREIQKQFPDLQVIATTHSPYIINECKPKEVIIMASDTEGFCVAERLSEHPKADRMLKVLTTGEFWSSEGENWVAKKKSA